MNHILLPASSTTHPEHFGVLWFTTDPHWDYTIENIRMLNTTQGCSYSVRDLLDLAQAKQVITAWNEIVDWPCEDIDPEHDVVDFIIHKEIAK